MPAGGDSMLLKACLILICLTVAALLIWILHAGLLLPIRRGACETITVTVSAYGEAPELLMQLRGLLWLRSNGMLPCAIRVVDTGLTAETSACLHAFAEEKGITISEQRGTEIHGRNESDAGAKRQHRVSHISE